MDRDYVDATGVHLVTVDARDRFLDALAGVSDPEEKRRIIGREFTSVFEAAALDLQAEAGEHGWHIDFLVQGTLYPDVVESGGGSGTANIKIEEWGAGNQAKATARHENGCDLRLRRAARPRME